MPRLDHGCALQAIFQLKNQGRPLILARTTHVDSLVSTLAEPRVRRVPEPKRFVKADGRLDLDKVLREFSLFWRQHGPLLYGKMRYREVSAQLVLLAYLQRVVNGSG